MNNKGMHLITSIMETRVSDPYARRWMRDEILSYLVPDYRPIYNTVVRDLNWFGPDLSQIKIGYLLISLGMDPESDEYYEYLPKSYFEDYRWVLDEINPETDSIRRFYDWVRRC
jgi:hypothetical protein